MGLDMSKLIDENKSIEDLTKDYWKDTDFSSSLVAQCYEYRKIPLKDLTIEQIRLLIGQNIGLDYLIPKAIVMLKINILAEGDFYPGDLLKVVLTSDEIFWINNQSLKIEVQKIINNQKDKIFDKKLLQEADKFRTK